MIEIHNLNTNGQFSCLNRPNEIKTGTIKPLAPPFQELKFKNFKHEASSILFSPKTLALQAIINRNFQNLAKLD